MPRILKLYRERPRNPVEVEQPSPCDPGCTRCPLSKARKLHNPCLPPEGTPGGLLVIDGHVGKHEDSVGRPLSGRTGRYLRPLLQKLWAGPIAVDAGVKCYPGSPENITADVVKACRQHLASTLAAVKPTKIIVLGRVAMAAMLGRSVTPMSVRKGYSWAMVGGAPVPVYLLPDLETVAGNRFLRSWFEEDLKWALTTDPPFGPAWDGEARVVENMVDARLAAEDIRAAGWFAYDVETSGYMWRAHQIVCASINPAGRDYAWVWSTRGLSQPGPLRVLIELLRDKGVEVVGANLQYDELSSMQDFKARIRGVTDDVRLLRKLLESDADADLGTMAELVGMGGHKAEANRALIEACRVVARVAKDNVSDQLELIPTAIRGLRADVFKSIRPGDPTKTYAYGFMPADTCITYNALDTVSTGRLKGLLNHRLANDEPELTRTYRNTVMPAAGAVRQITEWGMLVDMDSTKSFAMYLQDEKHQAMRKLERYAGGSFNPSSYEDVRELLFTKLGLTSTHKTGGGKESTQNEVLEPMRKLHPAVGLLLDVRKLGKLDGTYATGMIRHVRNDGRIHCNIKLDGTRSGRPSVTDPNLQTIPRDSDSDTGKMARDLFIAPPGYMMASLDYSQIELRVAAMLSGDPLMRQLFISGEDFHWATAKLIAKATWGITIDTSNPTHKKYRTRAKGVNFGLLYGQGDGALAEILGCSKQEAAKVRQAVLGQFSVLASWIKQQLADAKRTGYCWTYWAGERARRRSLWKLADPDGYESSKAERGSWNCLDEATEALTARGWVRGFELRRDDVLLTKNAETGALEWQAMTDLKQFDDYCGELHEWRSKSFSAVSTTGHRWLVRDKASGLDVCKTTEQVSLWGDHRIHRTGTYDHPGTGLLDEVVELAGWYLTDGTCSTTERFHHTKGRDYHRQAAVTLYQSARAKPTYVSMIDDLCGRLRDVKVSRSVSKRDQLVQWCVRGGAAALVQRLCPDRRLTMDLLTALSHEQCRLLFDTMMNGDGTRGTKDVFHCRDRVAAEAFQALATLCGKATSARWRDMSGYRPESPLINGSPKMSGVWVVNVLRRERVQVRQHHATVRSVRDFKVWCPVVPNTFFVARREGFVYITGNTPIQGSAAEYLTRSMTEVVDWILDEGIPAKVVLPVHDSLILEIDQRYEDEVLGQVHSIMTSHDSQGVPLLVDVETGPAWGSLEKRRLAA